MSKKIMIPIVSVMVIIVAVFIGIGFAGSKGENLNLSAATGETVTTDVDAGKSVKQIIKENAEEMKRRVDDLTSSNPYDYIDQECFDNIVALGFDAVKVLDDVRIDNGLDAYTAGLLIEKITGYDMGGWDTGSKFFQLWEQNIAVAPMELSYIICNDGMDADAKAEKIKEYGIFGEAFVKDVLANGKAAKLFYEEEGTLELTEEDKEKLEAIITSKDSEVEKAYQYLVKKSEGGQ